jgi:hypothetical protein
MTMEEREAREARENANNIRANDVKKSSTWGQSAWITTSLNSNPSETTRSASQTSQKRYAFPSALFALLFKEQKEACFIKGCINHYHDLPACFKPAGRGKQKIILKKAFING